LSQEQEETSELSKKEQIEQAASDMGYKICFKQDLEVHEKYIRIPWSNGTYTSIMVNIDPMVKNEDSSIKISYKFIKTDHRML